jgi:Polysaccharide lyase
MVFRFPIELNSRFGLPAILAASLVAGAGCGQARVAPSAPADLSPTSPFYDGFEGVSSFLDLFPEDGSRWYGYQLEPDDNRAEPSDQRAHSGAASLRLQAEPYDGHRASKADLELSGLRFAKGTDVWFSAWFFLEPSPDSRWLFLWDIEETQRFNSPGRRLYLGEGEALTSDLGKWWNDAVFRQPVDGQVPFPKGVWVNLVVDLFLSEAEDGHMQVWQDDTLVLSAQGQTLPTSASIYDRMQVGITANGNTDEAQVLYVDDVTLSTEPLR